MTKIVLTEEQARQVASAADGVEFVSESGATLCVVDQWHIYARDCEPLTADEERELLRRMADPPETFITTEELLQRLRKRFSDAF